MTPVRHCRPRKGGVQAVDRTQSGPEESGSGRQVADILNNAAPAPNRSTERSWWRTLGATVLVPNFLYGTSQGSIIPIVPLFAHQLGSSLATAALVAAMLPLGQWASNIPSGWLVGRFGERRTIYLGAAFAAAGAAVCWAAPTITVLG